MRSRIRTLLILLLAVFAVSCSIQPFVEPGKHAPDFTGTLLDARPISLSSLRGNVVVLDFWATWCPPCRKGLPHLQAMSADPALAKSGIAVIAIDEAEDDGTVRSFLTQNHYTFPCVRDGDGSVGRTFDVSVLPTTIVIGGDGTLKTVITGFTDETAAQIENAINAARGDSRIGSKGT